MKHFLLLLCLATSVAGCSKSSFDTGGDACSMVTADNEGFADLNKAKDLVCIDGQWYVKLDSDATYEFDNNQISVVSYK